MGAGRVLLTEMAVVFGEACCSAASINLLDEASGWKRA